MYFDGNEVTIPGGLLNRGAVDDGESSVSPLTFFFI